MVGNFMKSYEPSAPADGRAVSRRAVVKAGAHLAWSVPLIQVASMGAAHGDPVVASQKTLSITNQEGHWVTPSNNDLPVTVTVKALGGATTNLQIQLDFPADANNWLPKCSTGGGWTASPPDGTASRTRTFTATTQAAKSGEVTLNVTFLPTAGSNKGLGVTLTGAATATGFSSGGVLSLIHI